MTPEARGFKEKAEHLLDKLVDVYHESKKKQSSSSKPPSLEPGVTQHSNVVNQLSAPFNGLSISNPPQPSNSANTTFNGFSVSSPATPASGQANSDFIGGFNLAGVSASASAPCSPPRPPKIPIPYVPGQQSLTMQMALDPNYSTRLEYTEFEDMPLPPFTPMKFSRPQENTLSVTTGLSPPASPPRPNKPFISTPIRPSISSHSSISPPTTPSSKNGHVQCAGITKAGKRCTRQVKVDLAGDDGSDEEEKVPRFCYQHTDEVLVPSGYYARKNGEWVPFEDWIPPYLQKSTQASLRAEMEKARSSRDVPGYIYTFEIRDPDASKTIKLKVGRAVNLVKRIDQWVKQCGSKEQVLRGFYPGNVEEDESSLMKGRVVAGEKAAWCHRLERLVHIELADLASTCVYLEPGWPRTETPVSAPKPKSNGNGNGNGNGNNKPCADCGSMHREIFEFRRWEKGILQGKEWERIVRPVVERWGRFVDIYV